MRRRSRLMRRILNRDADANIRFNELCALLRRLGFVEEVSGSHHIFRKQGIDMINLQARGSHAKPYQVRQVRRIILRNRLEEP